MRTLFFTVVAFLIFGSLSIAVADEADKAELARLFPKGAHRLQMSYTYLNAAEADFAIWVPSYSWAYSRRLRITGLTGYADAKFHVPNAIDDSARSGLFDSFLVVQYDPGRRLTANSFVPNTLGLTFKLRAPTGDAAKGLGLDTWVGAVGAGWLVDFPYRFWLQPTRQGGRNGRGLARTLLAVSVPGMARNQACIRLRPGAGRLWNEPVADIRKELALRLYDQPQCRSTGSHRSTGDKRRQAGVPVRVLPVRRATAGPLGKSPN